MNTSLFHNIMPVVEDVLKKKGSVEVPSIPLSAQCLLALSLAYRADKDVVFITTGTHGLEDAHRNMRAFLSNRKLLSGNGPVPELLYFPPWEVMPAGRTGHAPDSRETEPDREIIGHRYHALGMLVAGRNKTPRVITTSIQALMQKTVDPSLFAARALTVTLGEEHDREEFAELLRTNGFDFTPEVTEKGEAAMRGSLIDVWPPPSDWPVRIEFDGDRIASLRTFDPSNQTSVEKIRSLRVCPSVESSLLRDDAGKGVTIESYLAPDVVYVWSEFSEIGDHAAAYEHSLSETGGNARKLIVSFQTVQSRLAGSNAAHIRIGADIPDAERNIDTDLRPVPGVLDISREALQPDILEQSRERLLSNLHARADGGETVVLFFDTQGAHDHFTEQFPSVLGADAKRSKKTKGQDSASIITTVGSLSGGFVSDALRFTVVAESDLYGHRRRMSERYDPRGRRRRPDHRPGPRISGLADVEAGELVVHVEHGIGRYLGLDEITFNGKKQETLAIEYDGGTRLHVPVSQAHLLSRYVGVKHQRVKLHRLGSKKWVKEKAAAEQSILDFASSLLETQAARNALTGTAFSSDTPWQKEFELSFPYRETPDQDTAIEDVKRDMESPHPMDRLLCGDAGYGKTEVAMRAAFKTAMEAKQTAVLVPTTVLAQQHADTFTARMEAYPVRIEMLSRFIPRSKQDRILRELRDGAVDIIIGTHSLLQPGVSFKELGLVIIDEEQRFGVAHKEKLKHLRRLVDVLTLTATPIPRTLYMSMMGARDMSLLQTPPQERMAIETIVARNTDDVIRRAVVREMNREGQVFFLHNRVQTIDRVGKRLERLVPEARVAVAHGQMPSTRLSSVMKAFVSGEIDVLLCTTIIESGMDIPRANTILIDRADRFGIADLYQLRGRVGRSNRKAYAYLLLPSHGHVESDARKRISAIRRFSGLGAGFHLALKDLEIRGAGNLLGRQQSGHIVAIGFGLYCQLLRQTVARMKEEPLPPLVDVDTRLDFISLSPSIESPETTAVIPYGYIADEHLRIEAYRKMAEAARMEDIKQLAAELSDRYGPLPDQVKRLLAIAGLRIEASARGIHDMEVRDGKVMLQRDREYLMEGKRFPRLREIETDKRLDEILALIRTANEWSA